MLVITVYGTPAPQGSKQGRPIYKGKGKDRVFTGKVAQVESSAKVTPWRDSVTAAAVEAMGDGHLLIERPVRVEMIFTLKRPKSRPSWWPPGEPWSKSMPMRPAGYPDVSKLARSTEDALTAAGVWADDGRVVEYGRLAKVYPGEDPDALGVPGAVIRVWELSPSTADQQGSLL
jgi:Holliday junction resolvase RusA-like endonuclease